MIMSTTRKTKTLEIFHKLKAVMEPGRAYRVEPLCRMLDYKAPALRRYLRRLVNAGLLTIMKHPEYPKRKYYVLSEKGTKFNPVVQQPPKKKHPSPQITEAKQQTQVK